LFLGGSPLLSLDGVCRSACAGCIQRRSDGQLRCGPVARGEHAIADAVQLLVVNATRDDLFPTAGGDRFFNAVPGIESALHSGA
jgi:hypothetical protein